MATTIFCPKCGIEETVKVERLTVCPNCMTPTINIAEKVLTIAGGVDNAPVDFAQCVCWDCMLAFLIMLKTVKKDGDPDLLKLKGRPK